MSRPLLLLPVLLAAGAATPILPGKRVTTVTTGSHTLNSVAVGQPEAGSQPMREGSVSSRSGR